MTGSRQWRALVRRPTAATFSSNMACSAAGRGNPADCSPPMTIAGLLRSAGDRDYAGASNPETMLFPTVWRHSLLMSGHQALGPDITLAADFLYKQSRLHSVTGYAVDVPPDQL